MASSARFFSSSNSTKENQNLTLLSFYVNIQQNYEKQLCLVQERSEINENKFKNIKRVANNKIVNKVVHSKYNDHNK